MRQNTFKILIVLLLFVQTAYAQTDKRQEARMFAEAKDYTKAADIYKELYKQNPVDPDLYREYFNVLLEAKEYKNAEQLAEEQQKIRPQYPLPFIDIGRIYLLNGKTKKATEMFDIAIQLINGDDALTSFMGNQFTAMGRDDYALNTYERARDILHNPYFYSGQLARLYAKKGDMDNAISSLLDGGTAFMANGMDDTKATLLELLGNDRKKQQLAQKALVKRINEHPENPFYEELLTWLYTQKDDWDGAMLQMQALDARQKEQGEHMLEFARFAMKEHHADYALKSYDAVLEKGKENAYYHIALSEKLAVQFQLLKDTPSYKPEDVNTLIKAYEELLAAYPLYYATQTIQDYATLLAQYAGNPQKAIDELQKAIDFPNSGRDHIGRCKLQLGDYLVLLGKVWDASLIYSQVDKAFREDMLGEDARFRNAKLSYYQGDFEYADGQLSVLKASTSELIANDAIYLSVLITENVTPDSNYVPLKRYAAADLLLFQNKNKEAETLLDSISKAYPEHPLKDDIFMLHAQISEKQRDYPKALDYLKLVYEKYGKDVLGDDAVYKTAYIYDTKLHQPDKAKQFYEQLIIDYPGSTYTQTARARLNTIQTGAAVLP